MKIERQSPGLTQLLAKLLPGLGSAIGGAAGGPVGGAFGGATGAGLGSLLNQPQPADIQLGRQPGQFQQDQQQPQNSALAASLQDLLSRLNSMEGSKEEMMQQGAPEEATAGAEQEQKDTFKKFYDMLSPDGQSQVLTMLKAIALPQVRR